MENSLYLETAIKAAKAGAEISLGYYHQNLSIHTKEDQTPFSKADTESETAIISMIKSKFPDHSFYAEESGSDKTNSDFCWIIDPIDGTKNYLAKIPLWGTLIALRHKDEIIFGLSYMPLIDEMLYAEKGQGAFLNGEKIEVSKVYKLSESMLTYGSFDSFKRKGYNPQLSKLLDLVKRQRSFGDLWQYHLLACGKLDIVVEASIEYYDVAPFTVIIKEAGGAVSGFDGEDVGFGIDKFCASNGKLHNQLLDILSKQQ